MGPEITFCYKREKEKEREREREREKERTTVDSKSDCGKCAPIKDYRLHEHEQLYSQHFWNIPVLYIEA
jgi:ABC-type Zn2+ transport system substrate-binding protein/surface adhesin